MTSTAQLGEAIHGSSERIGLHRRYDLGILLVHGLGEQARGDTLTVQGDPLVAWLRGRVGSTGKEGEAKVDVVDAVSRQQSTDAIPSAHAVLRITPPDYPDQPQPAEPSYWVVAEAFWAENFRQATFNEMLSWVMTVGPWVFATQVAGMVRRMEIGEGVWTWLRIFLIPITILVGFAFALLAAVVGFLVTVVAAAVFILAMTNLPFLADIAKEIQRQLANGLGDAQVLSRSPVRFGAMAAEVRNGLQVLREECKAVVLVAESQGTAVAWYGLKHEIRGSLDPFRKKETELAPIGLFLTHGQAVRKLTFALSMARGAQTARHTRAALASAAFVGLAVAAFLIDAPLVGVVSLVLALAAEAVLLVLAKGVWDSSGKELEEDWKQVLAADTGGLEWLDLWASADPAPVGPLGVDGDRISSYKIRNVGSTLADHVSYWRNTTEFLPILASYLFKLGGPREYGTELDDPRLLVPAMRRHARVMLLIPLRTFVSFGVVAGLVYARLNSEFGQDVVAFIHGLGIPFVSNFFDQPADWVETVAGFVAILAAGVVLWLVVSAAWNGQLAEDEKVFFRGKQRPLWGARWMLVGALVVPIAALVALLLVNVNEPELAVAYLLAATAWSLLSLAVLSSGGLTYGSEEKLEDTLIATKRITGNPWTSGAITLLVSAIIVAIPIVAWILEPDALPVVVAAETLVVSLILAIEGIREYRLFSRRFDELNAQLPSA